MPRRLTAHEKEQTRRWLIANRGSQPMGDLAADMSAKVPGWKIDRTRYGRYEKSPADGGLDIGPKVYDQFVAYWRTRGVEPPDLTPPAESEPVLSLEERQLALLERQVIAAERQAAAMELHVRLLARQTIATEAMAVQQGATLPSSSDDWVALEDDLLALGQRVLADRRSLAPLSAHLPSGEG